MFLRSELKNPNLEDRESYQDGKTTNHSNTKSKSLTKLTAFKPTSVVSPRFSILILLIFFANSISALSIHSGEQFQQTKTNLFQEQ